MPGVSSDLSLYSRAVRPPPQNSAKAKKLGGGSTARKSPIGSTNNQCGMKKTPTD
ncbi:hypothetical protein COJ77_05985 [Bacillus cereus]|nr:hypothetical protein COJ77_05985 [Bacillus cereus]